jgi:hypothetical protein
VRLEFSGPRFGSLTRKCKSFVGGRTRKLRTHRSYRALSPRLREKVEDLQDALLEFQVAERARQKVDKEAADAYEAHYRILAMIRRSAKADGVALGAQSPAGDAPWPEPCACRSVQARAGATAGGGTSKDEATAVAPNLM